MALTGLAGLIYAWRLLKHTKVPLLPWIIPAAALALAWFIAFFAGLGREYFDNTLYVSLRQILAVLQLVYTGILIYWGPQSGHEAKEIQHA